MKGRQPGRARDAENSYLSATDHPTHARISLYFLIEILRRARAESNVQKLSVNLSVEIGPHTLLGKIPAQPRPSPGYRGKNARNDQSLKFRFLR